MLEVEIQDELKDHSFLTSSVYLPVLSISFQKLSPRYRHFLLPSYNLFLPNRPFFCIYLQHTSSLYTSCSLQSPSDPAFCCALHPVSGEDGILVARTSSRRCFALISNRRQQLRVSQGIEVNFVFLYHLAFSALVHTCWIFCLCASPCWTQWQVGTKHNETVLNLKWQQNTNPKKEYGMTTQIQILTMRYS